MRLIFVRHGEPDYQTDTLTETGHQQAQRAALRLREEGITRLYSSTCGRAYQTAEHTARDLGLPIIPLPFMREIGWGPHAGGGRFEDGHPWILSDRLAREGVDLLRCDYTKIPGFDDNVMWDQADFICGEFDALLAGLGYRREGAHWRCERESSETAAVFSHGGSSGIVMAHLLGVPVPYFLHVCKINFTSVCVFEFEGQAGEIVTPFLRLLNDSRHIGQVGAAFFGH